MRQSRASRRSLLAHRTKDEQEQELGEIFDLLRSPGQRQPLAGPRTLSRCDAGLHLRYAAQPLPSVAVNGPQR